MEGGAVHHCLRPQGAQQLLDASRVGEVNVFDGQGNAILTRFLDRGYEIGSQLPV